VGEGWGERTKLAKQFLLIAGKPLENNCVELDGEVRI
jgi:hypothetical protein